MRLLPRAMIGMLLASLPASAWSAPVLEASQRQEFARWLRGDDALLVVLVFEGLRADALETEQRDGTPLMPTLTELATRSILYDDALTGAPHATAGAFELLAGVEARQFVTRSTLAPAWPGGLARLVDEGFTPLLGGAVADSALQAAFPALFVEMAPDLDTFLARLTHRIERAGRHLAVFFSSAPLPPPALDDTRLDATDPQPWTDAPPNATMDVLVERRRGTARSMSRALRAGHSLGTRRHAEVFAWITDAAAMAADETLARVLEAVGPSRRASLVVTSTLGTAVGDHGVVGAASGVDLGQARVPLVWHFPGGEPVGRSTFPAQLRDVASTLTGLLDARGPETGLDLTGEAPAERTRVSLAWFTRAGQPQAQFRLTNDALTLLVGSDGETSLYDRRWDRGEFENLASREPALVEGQRAALRAILWGDAPQLWILAKGDAGDLASAVVRGRGLGMVVQDGLEPLDAVQAGGDRVTFSLVADEADVLKISLPKDFEEVTVELQSPRRQSPLFLGPSASPWSGRVVRLGPFLPSAVEAWAGDDPPDPMRWLADRPSGLSVWLVGG